MHKLWGTCVGQTAIAASQYAEFRDEATFIFIVWNFTRTSKMRGIIIMRPGGRSAVAVGACQRCYCLVLTRSTAPLPEAVPNRCAASDALR